MVNTKMTPEQLLAYHKSNAPKDLVALYEGMADKLYDLADIKSDPKYIFTTEGSQLAIDYAMQACEEAINRVDYGTEMQTMESYVGADEIATEDMLVSDVHKHNLRQIMENSISDTRAANPNPFNMNELTPFDAFLPFTIIRSYLPMIGKDLIPTQTPAQPFIRIKQQYKYIVTKDNTRYLRPDIYNDTDKSRLILDSARGAEVTQEWYPQGVETEHPGDNTYEGADGKNYTFPEKLQVRGFDLLEASGGLIEVGDDLDNDIHVKGVRIVVTDTKGKVHKLEQTGYEAYPDLTSITPQRSVSFKVPFSVENDEGTVEKYEDTVYGDWNAATHTFNLVSIGGYVRQVQFGGHLSNKNNMEYFSFTNEFGVTQHPIPEGYNSQVPITKEDMDLYNQTSSIDIIASATNEMIEIFTQLEDSSIVQKIDTEFAKWKGKGEGEHPFEHFHGPVVFTDTVDVKPDSTRLMKRYEFIQDEIQYALSRFIGDMRDVCKAESFRLVAFAHPNICSLFVGNNVDWKITPGSAAGDGVRSDYSMGVYTANGDSFRIISSQKIKESDGVRFLLYPVNEQNFLSWKHFKYSMFFSRDYRNPQMELVPNLKGMSRFHTHSYTPLQAKLFIKNYRTATV